MQKIVFISALFLVLVSCSMIKMRKSVGMNLPDNLTREEIIRNLNEGNLSDSGVYIQKAEIEVIKDNKSDKFLATWKLDTLGNSLISVRSKTGIEIARIFFDKDTLLINDRINRKLYYGKPDYLRERYFVPGSFLPLLIGDYIGKGSEKAEESGCRAGILNLESTVKGIRTEYVADCKKGKIVNAVLFSEFGKKEIEINFSDFINAGNGFIASRIRIDEYSLNSKVDIRISRIEHPWYGDVVFIPGRKYELIELN